MSAFPTMTAPTVDILDGGAAVRLAWADGKSARFHAVWLRDNALDARTRHRNSQKLVGILDLPAGTRVDSADVGDDGRVALRFAPDGHESVFPAAWLRARSYDRAHPVAPGWVADEVELWRAHSSMLPRPAAFGAVSNDRATLARWLATVRRLGFARLDGVPTMPGCVCDVAALFGFVRETNYGRVFDVRASVDPQNLADTRLGLEAHTDNPYRDPVPTLQLLCCLANTVEGGETRLVDGFAVARRLRDEDPRGFASLARHPARFAYSGGNGVRLAAKRPAIELGPDGELIAVRFNNRSSAPLTDVPYNQVEGYYAALRGFAERVADPAMAVSFRLAPGDLFIVDNTRVLHARTAFSGGGTRWLQGCYADKDGLLSTLAVLEAEGHATR